MIFTPRIKRVIHLLILCSGLHVLAACGTEVGNPGDADENQRTTANDYQESAKDEIVVSNDSSDPDGSSNNKSTEKIIAQVENDSSKSGVPTSASTESNAPDDQMTQPDCKIDILIGNPDVNQVPVSGSVIISSSDKLIFQELVKVSPPNEQSFSYKDQFKGKPGLWNFEVLNESKLICSKAFEFSQSQIEKGVTLVITP